MIAGYTSARFHLSSLFSDPFTEAQGLSGEVRIKGQVDSVPDRVGNTLRFTLKTSKIIYGERHVLCKKNIFVKLTDVDSSNEELLPGDACAVTGKVFRTYCGRLEAIRRNCAFGIRARFSQCSILQGRSFTLARLSHVSREFFARKLKNSMHGRDLHLVEGVMFGRQKGEQSSLYDSLSAAGLSHIVAVSGLHVAGFSFTVLLILVRIGFGRKSSHILASFAGGIILALSGFKPSACRAFIMCAICFLGRSSNRTYEPITGLSLAGIIMTGLNTSVLLDPGFQLSFASTIGISVMANSISPDMETSGLKKLRRLLSVTSAAQLAVIPLLVLYGESVSLVSVIANLAVVPLVGPLLLSGWLTVFLSLLNQGVGKLAALLPVLISRTTYYVAVLASKLPAAEPVSAIGMTALFLYITGLIIFVRKNTKRGYFFVAFTLVFTSIAVILLPGILQGVIHGSGRIIFMDVGQGDAVLVEDGSGASILIDAGPDDDKAMKKLSRLGVRNLEALIISHPHSDHIAGIGKILRSIPVGVIIKPGIKSHHSNTLNIVEQTIKEKNIPVINPSRGMFLVISDKLSVEILHPVRNEINSCENVNDCSIVALVKLGNLKVLLPGDIEKEAQISLVHEGIDLSCAVLKIPHQGSRDAFCTEFLRTCNASVAVVSVEKDNKYGHPSSKFITYLRKSGVRVYRTDEDGDVTLLPSDGRIKVISKKHSFRK